MRKKVNHNFLKGGRSFYYRDSFSGLGSEKMSPALCFQPNLNDSKANQQLQKITAHYYQILFKHGSRKLNDHKALEDIIKKVLHDQLVFGGLHASKNLQRILIEDLNNNIFYYQQFPVFNKSYLKVPLYTAPVSWLKGLYERKPKNPT